MSVGWAIAVPLIAWWPSTVLIVQLLRPRPGEPGVDLARLLYIPAAVAWLPLVAITALLAWLVGLRLGNRNIDRRKRRDRGLVCGAVTVSVAVLALWQLG